MKLLKVQNLVWNEATIEEFGKENLPDRINIIIDDISNLEYLEDSRDEFDMIKDYLSCKFNGHIPVHINNVVKSNMSINTLIGEPQSIAEVFDILKDLEFKVINEIISLLDLHNKIDFASEHLLAIVSEHVFENLNKILLLEVLDGFKDARTLGIFLRNVDNEILLFLFNVYEFTPYTDVDNEYENLEYLAQVILEKNKKG